MIQEVLQFIVREINAFYRLKYDLNEDRLTLSGLVEPDGKLALVDKNKVILSLVNIEEENVARQGNAYVRSAEGVYAKVNPPIKVNLYLLFSAYFDQQNYAEALKFISATLGYFQSKKSFTPEEYPVLAGKADRLIFEIVNQDFSALNNLWGLTGSRYMPSVLLRMKTLNIQEAQVKEEITQIKGFG